MVVLNIKNRIKSIFKVENIKSNKLKPQILKWKELTYNKEINIIRTSKEIKKWVKNDRIEAPPQSYRRKIIKMYAIEFSIEVFIESGTFLGQTIEAVKKIFKAIYSIELNKSYHLKAKQKFIKSKHIKIFQGDSSVELPKILSNIDQPCLFWLDAHYSGGNTAKGDLETPIMKELHYILKHQNQDHIILIDDAQKFIGEDDYPTIAELRKMINEEYPDKIIMVKEDIIRIHKSLK